MGVLACVNLQKGLIGQIYPTKKEMHTVTFSPISLPFLVQVVL